MTEQPEALRLADVLDCGYPLEPDVEQAAAELRRLHAENTALKAQVAPQRQPLTTEQIAALESRRHRNLPPDFDYSEGAWFELGIRHGERAHGIGGDE